MLHPLGYEYLDRDQLPIEIFGYLYKLRKPSHLIIICHYLTDNSGGFPAGQSGEIDGRFRMAGSAQNASRYSNQREDVPGFPEIFRTGVRIDQLTDGIGTVWR